MVYEMLPFLVQLNGYRGRDENSYNGFINFVVKIIYLFSIQNYCIEIFKDCLPSKLDKFKIYNPFAKDDTFN